MALCQKVDFKLRIHLEDCSSIWEEMVEEASDSIVVFTPYFDRILVNLFASSDDANVQKTLVTDLDWIASSAQDRKKLVYIIHLIGEGVDVRVLDRLHAKILVVDHERAVFGSQNFTSYSTSSFEISTEIEYGDDDDGFFDEIEELLRVSRPISWGELEEVFGNSSTWFSEYDDDED